MTFLHLSGLHLVFVEILKGQEARGPALLGRSAKMLHSQEVAAARQVAGSYLCLIWERPLVVRQNNTRCGRFPNHPGGFMVQTPGDKKKKKEDLRWKFRRLFNINGQSLALQ